MSYQSRRPPERRRPVDQPVRWREGAGSSRNRPPRRKRRRYRLRLRAKILLGLLLVLILFALARCGASGQQEPVQDKALMATDTSGHIQAKDISSHAAIAINAKNGEVLFAKAAEDQKYPASLTKLMTLYVALLDQKDLSQEVELTSDVFTGLAEKDLATAGFQVGDKVTVEDLMYATILPSGADAARALAIVTSGSEEAFVERMNEEAAALGMRGTYFVNVTGAHDPKHVSTVADMAKLMRTGLKNDTFAQVIQSMHYTTEAPRPSAKGLRLDHSLARYLDNFDRVMADPSFEILGGKTGYTGEAGLCLATLGRDRESNERAIVVTMDGKGTAGNYYPALRDAAVLYEGIFKG